MGLFADAADLPRGRWLPTRSPDYRSRARQGRGVQRGLLRTATGELRQAIADGNRYLAAVTATGADADEVVFLMGKAHQNAGRNKEAADLYRSYAKRSKNHDIESEGCVLLATVLLEDRTTSAAPTTRSGRRGRRSASSEGGARARRQISPRRTRATWRASASSRRFDKIEIAGDVKQLSARLKQKAELLKQAANVFLDCVSHGRRRVDDRRALPDRSHLRDVRQVAAQRAAAVESLRRRQRGVPTQIDEFVVPIEEQQPRGVRERLEEGGRVRHLQPAGPRRCAKRSGASTPSSIRRSKRSASKFARRRRRRCRRSSPPLGAAHLSAPKVAAGGKK